MLYWPSYKTITPEARRAYLQGLVEGRRQTDGHEDWFESASAGSMVDFTLSISATITELNSCSDVSKPNSFSLAPEISP
ncbi:TerB N-terminal domain-containing protein [Pseudomonas sp. BBP2017]|uniref:TerB N-terminal domain-containing protein n=1 Tax=Pseudomonas sp. BBP2017 TaxID=2109731 RepID=UPI0021144869|nr:TerB N-terminal domain-containing protein [Pseudomonas sp. BBP2017]